MEQSMYHTIQPPVSLMATPYMASPSQSSIAAAAAMRPFAMRQTYYPLPPIHSYYPMTPMSSPLDAVSAVATRALSVENMKAMNMNVNMNVMMVASSASPSPSSSSLSATQSPLLQSPTIVAHNHASTSMVPLSQLQRASRFGVSGRVPIHFLLNHTTSADVEPVVVTTTLAQEQGQLLQQQQQHPESHDKADVEPVVVTTTLAQEQGQLLQQQQQHQQQQYQSRMNSLESLPSLAPRPRSDDRNIPDDETMAGDEDDMDPGDQRNEEEDMSNSLSHAASNNSKKTSSSPSKKEKETDGRKRWLPEEDEIIRTMVAKQGAQKWNQIADKIPGRNGNQVRLRWCQYLSPEVSKTEFSEQDDVNILRLQQVHGNKWKVIGKIIGKRHSYNDIKNRYHALQRRMHAKNR
eukprot:CAMPEP_0184706308 /NCGR_PEP_ID=MMETSP0313-20130426/36693_1 /TAXON_ID=2792 /ORGANISM="Porphyridium aerugineum, Strain SAG 1380-2" /LENGTH=405 /DNA_ID=CAMNT_0027167859 /DNA_START=223 /DNA_END=1444 /DNA_ORIENTATION=-